MVAKHREATQGFHLRRLVLKDVPILGELAVLETHDIGRDPTPGPTVAGKAPVRNDVVAFSEDHVIVVTECFGKGATRLNKPSRPGGIGALCWMQVSDQNPSAVA
jgi:hypothetical protein